MRTRDGMSLRRMQLCDWRARLAGVTEGPLLFLLLGLRWVSNEKLPALQAGMGKQTGNVRERTWPGTRLARYWRKRIGKWVFGSQLDRCWSGQATGAGKRHCSSAGGTVGKSGCQAGAYRKAHSIIGRGLQAAAHMEGAGSACCQSDFQREHDFLHHCLHLRLIAVATSKARPRARAATRSQN